MSYVDWLAKGSEHHRVERDGAVLTISAIDDALPSLKHFQPIVMDVMERDGVGYTVLETRRSAVHPGKLIDQIVIQCEEDS